MDWAGRTESRVKGLKRTLYSDQPEVSSGPGRRTACFGPTTGAGKDGSGIASCHILWRTGRVRRGLVMRPRPQADSGARMGAVHRCPHPCDRRKRAPSAQALYQSTKQGCSSSTTSNCLRDLEVVRRWERPRSDSTSQRIKNWATKTDLSVKVRATESTRPHRHADGEPGIEELASGGMGRRPGSSRSGG